MLKVRVIPTLLWKNDALVKGVGFDSWRRVGSALPAIKIYNARQVDELILLDIDATSGEKDPDFALVASLAEFCFVPLTVGGGIKTLAHAKHLLRSGADKVSINSAAYQDPSLISNMAKYFGSQCVVVSIDVKKNAAGKYICYSHSGKQDTGIEVVHWAKKMAAEGAGEILLTAINHDGAFCGYDVDLIRLVSEAVNIPVIASGGASQYEDFTAAITVGGASAVAAASVFHFTEKTPQLVKQHLFLQGIPVRGIKR
jgi:imidazole glycerol-phosphate synthase subunit HisF